VRNLHPIPLEQQGNAEEVEDGGGVHGVADDTVGAGGDHGLLPVGLDADLRGGEGVGAEYQCDQQHAGRDQGGAEDLCPDGGG
jgi:hypothetical protein